MKLESNLKLDSHSKILIVGTSGSGKSTLAKSLAKKLQINDIELDALFWKENWSQSDQDEFRTKISNAMSTSSGWVIHGNYNKVRDLTWGNSKIIIWLDYPKSIVMWRVFKRSLLRIIKNELLWAGNKESFKKTFFSQESIILWAWQTYSLRKKQYNDLINDPQYKHIQIIQFKKPADAESFLNSN